MCQNIWLVGRWRGSSFTVHDLQQEEVSVGNRKDKEEEKEEEEEEEEEEGTCKLY